jgi:hypothetical protein
MFDLSIFTTDGDRLMNHVWGLLQSSKQRAWQLPSCFLVKNCFWFLKTFQTFVMNW